MQLKPSQVKTFREALVKKQGGLCALCGLPFTPGTEVLDHDHLTGHVRGAIHRACNSTLGRVENGRRYGKSFDPVSFAKGLHTYLTMEQTLPLHPSHGKTRKRK